MIFNYVCIIICVSRDIIYFTYHVKLEREWMGLPQRRKWPLSMGVECWNTLKTMKPNHQSLWNLIWFTVQKNRIWPSMSLLFPPLADPPNYGSHFVLLHHAWCYIIIQSTRICLERQVPHSFDWITQPNHILVFLWFEGKNNVHGRKSYNCNL